MISVWCPYNHPMCGRCPEETKQHCLTPGDPSPNCYPNDTINLLYKVYDVYVELPLTPEHRQILAQILELTKRLRQITPHPPEERKINALITLLRALTDPTIDAITCTECLNLMFTDSKFTFERTPK